MRNGIDRNNDTYGNEDYRVVLPLKKAVTYAFPSPEKLSNIRLQFDTDLDRNTLPGIPVERQRSMRANRTQESPSVYLPKTLVKSYQLTAVTQSGELITIAETDLNILGCVNHSVPEDLYESISFIPLETWGDNDKEVSVFSFDFS